MNFINQKDETCGCGIATFANAVGFNSYDQAKSWLKKYDFVNHRDFITIPQMQNALSKKLNTFVSLHNKDNKDYDTAVLFVVYQEMTKQRHWIYYSRGLYFDPLPTYAQPSNSIKYRITRILKIHS